VRSTPLSFEELHKITLCNLALGKVYWHCFLIRAVGCSSLTFDFTLILLNIPKAKGNVLHEAWGLQKL
jgi:hypothetical protein